MGSSMHAARAGGRGGPRGFTLLAILVVLAALTLVVGMALQRGEDERRNAYLVQHDALALSAAEFGLDRTRAYVGSALDNELDLDKVLDPNLDTDCAALPLFDGGTAEDHLPVIDGGTVVTFSGRQFLRFPYSPGADGGMEGAYLVRIEDNDDDGVGIDLPSSTNNNRAGTPGCEEGPALLALPSRSNPVRDRDRTVVVTVVGLAPGSDPTRAQARKVLRARLGSPPAAGIVSGGSIDLSGAAHVCGDYGNVSVNNGDFMDGCVCGSGCSHGPAYQSCGIGDTCDVQVSGSTCSIDFGGGGGTCTTNVSIPPPPKVEVWSKLNAPPACLVAPCIPFYYLRADLSTDKAQVHMWNYSVAGCEDPQAFSRIHYPNETASPANSCWNLVYDGKTGPCPGDKVQMKDESSLSNRNPSMTTCTSASTVFLSPGTGTHVYGATCDSPSTLYPEVGDNRYKRHYLTGGMFVYQPTASAPIPHGVWFVDGDLTFKDDTPAFGSTLGTDQLPVTLIVTGDVLVENNTTVRLRPAHRDVALMAGRDLEVKGGNSMLLTCGDPTGPLPSCPSAAIMVHEQFKMGSNSHLQGQLVVQNAATCSGFVTGNAIDMQGNATISVPALPPISSSSGAAVLSWGESSL